MKYIDAEVTREEWIELHNRGICARIKPAPAEEILAAFLKLRADPALTEKITKHITRVS